MKDLNFLLCITDIFSKYAWVVLLRDNKFKVGDHVRIFKYKNIFAEGYTPNWSEKIFVIKKVINTVPWTYVINDFNGEKNIKTFYEKKLQKTN